MVYYKLVKVTMNTPSVAKVILDMIVRQHQLPYIIDSDKDLLLTPKFCLSLYYFLGIKRGLFTDFHP